MPPADRPSETAGDQPSTDGASESDAQTNAASTGVSEGADAPANPSVPEGFGEAPDDREASRWGGYALVALLAAVFVLGLVRLVYPNASILVVGTLLALFGVVVGLLAVRTRFRES